MAMDLRLVKSPKGTKLKFVVWHASRKHLACLRTAKAAVANMIKGVTPVSYTHLTLPTKA